MRSYHRVVELLEECVVFFFSGLFGEAERLDAFDENFGGVGLGLEDFDGLGEIVLEGHGARVGGLVAAHQLGLDVGWGDFDDLDVCGLELVTERLAPGVDGGFGGVIGGCYRHGEECKAGGDSEDRGVGLLLQMWEERGGEADGTEQIGGDHRLGVSGV